MSSDFDVIIIGSGPAGVSAAFPLVEAGLRVLMVDGGERQASEAFSEPYLLKRQRDSEQTDWMLGAGLHSLRNMAASSPKLRIPAHAYVFKDFERLNKITSESIVSIGSIAQGGLSNVWGCGVACLSASQLAEFPFRCSEMTQSYAKIAERMGISGSINDDLSDYFGLDDWADEPIEIDSIQRIVLERYKKQRLKNVNWNFKLGRARVAALSKDRSGRKACNLSGNCLWGCSRHSLYSATQDLASLRRFPLFTYRAGCIVDELTQSGSLPGIKIASNNKKETIYASKVLVGAGTLATTRLAMRVLKISESLSVQSSPVAAFMLWIPSAMGKRPESAFALGQLAFTTNLLSQEVTPIPSVGSLFNCSSIPISEFTPYLPMNSRYGIDLLKILLRSCVVGNFYLPGRYTQIEAKLNSREELNLSGQFHEEVNNLMAKGKKQLCKAFRTLGAFMLPGSFNLAKPGADLHYGASLPMRLSPVLGETDANGSLFGMQNIHIIDGASLPSITEKPHTLTIMANADRIGQSIVQELQKSIHVEG